MLIMRKLFSILFLIWFSTLVYPVFYKLISVPNKQHRFVTVAGLEIDFNNSRSLTIGGYSNDIKNKPLIQIPTKHIPLDFGKLILKNNQLSLKLSNKVSDKDNEYLIETTYPSVYLTKSPNKRFSKGEKITQQALLEGITIDYAVSGKVKLSFKQKDKKKFWMFISHKYTNLRYTLHNYYEQEGQQMEFSINGEQSEKTPNFNIPLIELDFPNSNKANCTLTFKEDGIYQDRKQIASVDEIINIPNTKVLIKLEPQILLLPLFWVLFLGYSILGVVIFFRLKGHLRKKLPQAEKQASFDIVFFAIGILFNLSIPLALHYAFFFPYRPERLLPYLHSGLISLGIYGLLYLLYGELKPLIDEKVMNFFSKKKVIRIVMIVEVVLILLLLFSKNERLFILPAHFLGRIIFVISLFIVSMSFKIFFNIKNFLLGALLLLVGGLYAWLTKDLGFIVVSLFFVFLFLLIQKQKINVPQKQNRKIPFSQTLFVKVIYVFLLLFFVGYLLPQMVQKYDFFPDRFHLVYGGMQESINIDDQLSSVYHNYQLLNASKSIGYGSEYIIPRSFRTVIHTDYILLFAFTYYGIILKVIIIITIFLIGFLLARWCLYLYFVDKYKYAWLFFIILSYVAQIYYMYGAMLRVFPLTGQSIPFLSLSRTEPVMFIIFLIFSVIVLKYNTEQKLTKELQEEVKELSRNLLWIYSLLFIGITVIGIVKYYESSVPYKDTTQKLSYTSVEYQKKLNEILSHFKMRKNSNLKTILEKTKIEDIASNSEYFNEEKKLFLKFLAEEYSGQENRFSFTDTFLYYNHIFYRTPNYQNFVSSLTYKPFKSKTIAYFDNNKIRLEQIGNMLFTNDSIFYDKIGNPLFIKFNDIRYNKTSKNRKVLLGDNPKIQTRLVNNKERVVVYNADILGYFAEIDTELLNRFDEPPKLSIDPKLQVLLYGLLNNLQGTYDKIDIKSIVILENATGEIKAVMSKPFLRSNATELEKGAYKKAFNNTMFDVNSELCNIALTGYNVASTFKVFMAGGAVLTDLNYHKKKFTCYGQNKRKKNEIGVKCLGTHNTTSMKEYIGYSCNHYSALLIKDLYENKWESFLQHLESDLYINTSSYDKFSPPPPKCLQNFELPTIGKINEKYLPQTSIGMYNVKIPLVIETSSFSRLITGKKTFPTIFKSDIKFDSIQNSQRLKYVREGMEFVIEGGTGRTLNKIGKGIKIKYAKTGTGSGKSSFLIFSTGKYTYGLMFLNTGGLKGKTAKSFAKGHLIRTINQINSNYLK